MVYREGEQVEVWTGPPHGGSACKWTKAKVIRPLKDAALVLFPDGSFRGYEGGDIRPIRQK
jgi:hypothetical protein